MTVHQLIALLAAMPEPSATVLIGEPGCDYDATPYGPWASLADRLAVESAFSVRAVVQGGTPIIEIQRGRS